VDEAAGKAGVIQKIGADVRQRMAPPVAEERRQAAASKDDVTRAFPDHAPPSLPSMAA